jgi:endonuclease III
MKVARYASLRPVVTALRRHYGKPAPPVSRDPFHLILWEQVGYLVPDTQRRRAFMALRKDVGLRPAAILAASPRTLERITRLGGSIAARSRAARLRESAERVIGRWDGDLGRALRLPVLQSRRALAEFSMIGEPGADKILAFTRQARLVPLDSNALRVVTRLGLTPEGKDYRSSYRRAQQALARAIPRDPEWPIRAYSLLRRHGQELCRRRSPACERCPLQRRCPSADRFFNPGASHE